MNILALDSTAGTATVALCRDSTPLCLYSSDTGLNHSETLLPMIESVLNSSHMNIDDIDMFAISVGPGSFTGVRIGVSLLKGLAFGKNKPCVPVSTLEALAQNILSFDGIICPVMDARRAQVYNALFESDGKSIKRLTADRAIALSDLEKELAGYKKPIYFAGDGCTLAKNSIANEHIKDTPVLLINQNAYSVAQCALKIYEETPDNDYSDRTLSPVYLRLPQAERERLEKQKKTN